MQKDRESSTQNRRRAQIHNFLLNIKTHYRAVKTKYYDYRDKTYMVVCVLSRQRRPYVSCHGNRNIS